MTDVESEARSEARSESTFIGLHEWFNKVFEHHGWVLLCHDKCGTSCSSKCHAHLESMEKLSDHLKSKMAQVNEGDRKRDLLIMSAKVERLHQLAKDSGLGSGGNKSKPTTVGNREVPMTTELMEERMNIEQGGGAKKKKKAVKSKSKEKKTMKSPMKKSKSKSKSKGKAKKGKATW